MRARGMNAASKEATIERALDRVGTAYRRDSALRRRLVQSLSSKLSTQDVIDLDVVLLASPAASATATAQSFQEDKR